MKNALLTLFFFTMIGSYAQVGIGTTTPDNSAALEISSTSKGLLLPRLTRAQIDAISNPAVGLLVFCSDCSPVGVFFYNGTVFQNTNGTGILGFGSVVGAGGAVWLDRNLGSDIAATSLTDATAYGDLYQWGRTTDGHQLRTSSLRSGPVDSGSEGNRFIVNEVVSQGAFQFFDWLNTPDATRWSGDGLTKGPQDPCPTGYRAPTSAEWSAEITAWTSQNGFNAFQNLKLTYTGARYATPFQVDGDIDLPAGTISFANENGYYWSSTTNAGRTTAANYLFVSAGTTQVLSVDGAGKSNGMAVRCIQE